MYKLEYIAVYTRDYTIFLSNLVDRRQNDQSDSTSENIQAYILISLLSSCMKVKYLPSSYHKKGRNVCL